MSLPSGFVRVSDEHCYGIVNAALAGDEGVAFLKGLPAAQNRLIAFLKRRF